MFCGCCVLYKRFAEREHILKSFAGMCLLPVEIQTSIPLTVPMSHTSRLIPLPPLMFCCRFLRGPKILGSQQLALACDELALWLGLYMFLKMEVQFPRTKPAVSEYHCSTFMYFI